MEENRKIILEQIVVFRRIPVSELTSDLRKLSEWAVIFSSQLIFLGQATIGAERDYWKKLSEFRRNVKTKADAEILANATDEYQRWRELKYLREDLTIQLAILKKLFDEVREERVFSNRI